MLILDDLLIGGLRFVLDKIAAAVETELNDDSKLREELLAAQMRLELGEISEAQFQAIESGIVERLREIRARLRGGETAVMASGEMKITGIDATFEGDEH
ncbi:MAG: hypothetical protein HOQ29_05300 [Acidobacteria bacterium]|nr:hypothetical protein [Acidobacteriota bacterium]